MCIQVYESSESGDVKPTDDNLVVSTEEKGYSCERNKTFKSLFEHPVVLVANNWYLAHIKITSPSGASTDAGSSGQAQVTGPDSVVFNFKNSRESNNGTDVGSGQIPEFLYRIPEFEQETDTSLQLLDKEFAVSVSPCGLQSLQNILEWSWNQLLSADDPNIVDRLKIVVECSLSILSSHIKEVYPAKGIKIDLTINFFVKCVKVF
jgi:E3 ubiquitin-protein ligase MYCBP2